MSKGFRLFFLGCESYSITGSHIKGDFVCNLGEYQKYLDSSILTHMRTHNYCK